MANSSATSYNNCDAASSNGPPAQSIGHSVFEEPTTSPSNSVASFIASQFGRKHDDLKTMLDSTKDAQKLDAMKRIVGMMASGKDVSELFPAVVKNVVSKNIEIKKLVYVYLVRYAEEQQDLALLSIATFQRGLKDPNQLIRASALRVLSSIRVTVIVPIMMLALKEAVSDMSPYVRKTAANAIPKLFCLDPEQKEHLIEIIEKLLQDKTTLVAGSTVIAFEEVCPERIDLIHKNYRKLCNMLIDIDEWGQVAVVNMLVRYARTQFLDPNKQAVDAKEKEEEEKAFYPSSDSDDSEASDADVKESNSTYTVDADHRLLLRSCLPLLRSRNAAVVMAVAKIYHHIAPASEVSCVVKALVRLLRSHREVQAVVLSNIITMSLQRKSLFEPFIRTFFVHSSDPTLIKKLKLDILTNLATESNIPLILREFQTYVSSPDKDFAASTIQAIGRCASNIPEVGDTCLAGLIRMLSNRDSNVVGESIIVIKKLLQMHQKDHSDVITHMAKLLDKVHVPMARASILWLIGEYSARVAKIAPDVLRKMAITFAEEDDIVKLQILTLGAKLYVSNSKQTRQLYQYILQVAKYDQNYDIRDRARFMKFMLFPIGDGVNNLKKKAKKIFLVEKPAPILESLFKDRAHFQLGSLSHEINAKATGYQELPAFPEEQPDVAVRNVEVEQPVWGNQFLLTKEKEKDREGKEFYSGSGEESSEEDCSDEDEDEDGDDVEDEGGTEEEESSEEEESEDEGSEFEELTDSDREPQSSSSDEQEDEEETQSEVVVAKDTKPENEESESESEEETSSEEESESEDEPVETVKPVKKALPKKQEVKKSPTKKKQVSGNVETYEPNQSSYDQLLDLDDFDNSSASGGNIVNGGVIDNTPAPPSLLTDMESLSLDPQDFTNMVQPSLSSSRKSYELLNKINGKCLTADYCFTRGPCVYARTMIGVEIEFRNQGNFEIKKIRVGEKKLAPGSAMQEFAEIGCLAPGDSKCALVGIDIKDTMQPVKFNLCTETDTFPVTLKVPVGELICGITLTEHEFTVEKSKLTGMTESVVTCDITPSLLDNNARSLHEKVVGFCNMNKSPSPPVEGDRKVLRFSAQLVSSCLPVLLTIEYSPSGKNSNVSVNCEKISFASILAKELKTILTK